MPMPWKGHKPMYYVGQTDLGSRSFYSACSQASTLERTDQFTGGGNSIGCCIFSPNSRRRLFGEKGRLSLFSFYLKTTVQINQN